MAESAGGRDELLRELRQHGISDRRVLAALERVPREQFIEPGQLAEAYRNAPLPIGEGQTISQPFVVAFMLQELGLAGTEKVLEIGTGSGYQTALLAELAHEIVSIERHVSLAKSARDRLSKLGYRNVQVFQGDGTLGWKPLAPYNAVVVSAGAPTVPNQLMRQLDDGGRLILPVGDLMAQELVLITRQGRSFSRVSRGPVRFVPLVGREGWGGRVSEG